MEFSALGPASAALYAASAPMTNGLVRLSAADGDGIAVVLFDRPKKLNGWNPQMLRDFSQALRLAADDVATRAVIVTGSGKYYSAGAAFAEMIAAQMGFPPVASLLRLAEAATYDIFETYIAFPKPLFVAVNGPAIGGGCTSLLHADVVVASSRATFEAPFARLGLPPEGCAPVTFPARVGEAGARAMLVEGRRLDAAEALKLGFVDVVADDVWISEGEGRNQVLRCERGPEALLETAKAEARKWLAAPPETRQRRPSDGKIEEFRKINRSEARTIARALLGKKFIDAQYRLAKSRGKPTLAWSVARALQPVLEKGDAALMATLAAVVAVALKGGFELAKLLQ